MWKTIHSSKNHYLPNIYYIGIISHSKYDLTKYNEVREIGSICDSLILNDDLKELKKTLDNDIIKSKDSISDEKVIQIWDKFKG